MIFNGENEFQAFLSNTPSRQGGSVGIGFQCGHLKNSMKFPPSGTWSIWVGRGGSWRIWILSDVWSIGGNHRHERNIKSPNFSASNQLEYIFVDDGGTWTSGDVINTPGISSGFSRKSNHPLCFVKLVFLLENKIILLRLQCYSWYESAHFLLWNWAGNL